MATPTYYLLRCHPQAEDHLTQNCYPKSKERVITTCDDLQTVGLWDI